MSKFIYCPWCNSAKVSETDYEIDDQGTVDEQGRRCDECGWEGDASELVSTGQAITGEGKC